MTNQPTPVILDDEALAELERDISTCDSAVFPITVEMAVALCKTVQALEAALRKADEVFNESCDRNIALREQLAQIEKERDDLLAANISKLLTDIKERLTPEEGREFQSLLMSATRGWVDEVTERSEVDRGLLEAFKDLPRKKRK